MRSQGKSFSGRAWGWGLIPLLVIGLAFLVFLPGTSAGIIDEDGTDQLDNDVPDMHPNPTIFALEPDMSLSLANASFIGENAEDQSGTCVVGVGDVNSDGFDDLLISSPYNSEVGHWAGKIYLILGRANVTVWNDSDPLDLAYANASFIGEVADDFVGGGWTGLAGPGDVNSDGYADILIGASANDEGAGSGGKVYLILGRANVTAWNNGNPLDLAYANASFIGTTVNHQAGFSVAGAGDVNNDGYADLLVGAYGSSSYAGKTYLILGRADVTAWNGSDPLELPYANASFLGENADDYSGYCVAGAGDVNNDSYADLLIGAYANDEVDNYAGKTYLLLGRPDVSAWANPVDLSNANASFLGENGWDNSGKTVAGPGDVNGDGYADLLIAAHQNDEGALYAGKTYLILGRPDVTAWNGGDPLSLAYANASFIGENEADISGNSVAGAGDVNNDGYMDLLIGAPTTLLGLRASSAPGMMHSVGRDNPQLLAYEGQAYLLLGRPDVMGWNGSDPLNLAYANASFLGESSGDFSARKVAGAGDINGDGVDDILISNSQNDEGGNRAGKTYLLLGVDTMPPKWTVNPTDQVSEWGTNFQYDLEAFDFAWIDHWWINDTTSFSIDDSGRITNATALEKGMYWLEVRAYDPFDHYCSATFNVTVLDSTLPTWTPLPTKQVVEFGTGLSYALSAADLSGIDHWWVNDTTHFSVNASGTLTNATTLVVGTYWVEVRAYDSSDNYCTASFNITVQDTTAPTWIGIPTTPIIEITVEEDYEPPAYYDLNASDLSGIDHWWVNDTTHFSIDAEGRITKTTDLSVGIYGLEVRAYDPYDNYCSATFKITIQATTESEDGSGFTLGILLGGLLAFAIIRQGKRRNQ